MHDVLTNLNPTRISCLDKGFVELVDVMPRLVPEDRKTADFAIVQAARVSYGPGTKTVNEDRGLIRYLLRHAHTTPLEMVEFKFHCKMPVFVARQWIRHRTANVNEVSGRYSILPDEFYTPEIDDVRSQSKTNKQGSDIPVDETTALHFIEDLDNACVKAYSNYKSYLEAGVGREQARMILPLNLYTEWYWKIDLHNLFHFLSLRCDLHAQKEIRVFGDAMLSLIKPIVPFAVEAFDDYHHYRGAVRLSKLEVEALRKYISVVTDSCPDEYKYAFPLNSDNKREQSEWVSRASQFGLQVKID